MGGTCIILPVGVTRETVEGLLKSPVVSDVSCIITVLIEDSSEEMMKKKREIIGTVEVIAKFLGAEYREFWTTLKDGGLSARIYEALLHFRPSRIILSGVTGSRYVLLPLLLALRWYGRREDVRIYVVHGIEGDGWLMEPLAGYLVDDLTPAQKRVFTLIYSHPGEEIRTKEDLIEKHGFGRSLYKILNQLRCMGLIEWGRNRIRKTYPGTLLYNLLRVEQSEAKAQGH